MYQLCPSILSADFNRLAPCIVFTGKNRLIAAAIKFMPQKCGGMENIYGNRTKISCRSFRSSV